MANPNQDDVLMYPSVFNAVVAFIIELETIVNTIRNSNAAPTPLSEEDHLEEDPIWDQGPQLIIIGDHVTVWLMETAVIVRYLFLQTIHPQIHPQMR
jgi:hypothetical protein